MADTSTKFHRRLVSFSLVALLLILVIPVSLVWTINKPLHPRSPVVVALEKMGFHVDYSTVHSGENEITKVFGVDAPVYHESQITDAQLFPLRELTQLNVLVLRWTKVTDAGLVHLKGLTQLQDLSLQGTQVTDTGLAHLRGLPHLRTLNLQGTQVTDAGVVDLREMTHLKWLNLQKTHVTDAGAQQLQESLPKCMIVR